MSLYPLKFKPRYVQKMWGGSKLQSILGKKLPDAPIGESWEIYDFPPGVVDSSTDWVSSVVAEGPLSGATLHELVTKFGRDITGDVALVAPSGQFPILIKFLDAREALSIQVHPDEAYAKANPGAHLKNEAWYVVQADKNARLLKGLKPGVTREKFAEKLTDGTVDSLINTVPVKAGDCFYLPSGTVHALGAGILAAEVQTPSDTTYRVFDFNRVDPSTGEKRKLHIDQAMQCINFSAPLQVHHPLGEELVRCEHFSIRKLTATAGQNIQISNGPVVLMVIEGSGEIFTSGGTATYRRGETILLPDIVKQRIGDAESDTVILEVILGNRE
jgi:mannose-6-phosphate isomerase